MSLITKVIIDVTNVVTILEIQNPDTSMTIHELNTEESVALWYAVPTEATLYDCVKKILVDKLTPEGFMI